MTYIEIVGKARAEGRTALNEIESKELMKMAGIPVIESKLASNKKEAIDFSQELGFPAVMKILSQDVIHKSDSGGVKLGIINSAEAGKAYDDIIKSVKQNVPGARIEGVSVQKMAGPGLELVVGMSRDPHFGPVLMFGAGGIFVEILKDVAFRIIPLNGKDAHDMIREIKSYKLLEGFRGQPAVDLNQLKELLLKVSQFIENNPEIKEMDINPLVANSDGLIAVDARIILDDPPSMSK